MKNQRCSLWRLGMAVILFGARHADPKHPILETVELALEPFSKNFRECTAEIVMRGSCSQYDEWIAVEISASSESNATACVEWLTKQVTRHGFALIASPHEL